MNVVDAIKSRKSIRNYCQQQIDNETIRLIIEMGLEAPIPKSDREMRSFIVVKGEKKEQLIKVFMNEILNKNKVGIDTGSSILTCRVMKQAPVIILIYRKDIPYIKNNGISSIAGDLSCADIQSVGATIQNMLLTATDLEIGSLWIGDIIFAEDEINKWVNTKDTLVAAVAFGYTKVKPHTFWRECTQFYEN